MGTAVVRTLAVDGSKPRYLGQYGAVSGLHYSYTLSGGCEQLSCALAVSERLRTDGLDPGRLVQALLGASVVWEGTLDEPQQSSQGGWSLTAHGSGTWGSDFTADYTPGQWATQAPDTIIGNAVSRGLGWLPSTVGHPAGMFLGQPPDPGAAKIDEMLNQLTSLGGLVWQVKRGSWGNQLRVDPIVTTPTPTRLLVSTAPAPRTLAGDINAIQIRYNSVPDLGPNFPAQYATVWAVDNASIAKHGRKETFLDIGSNGPMLSTDAQSVGNYVLQRYQRAMYAGPYTARYGELLTIGGQPIDLAAYWLGNEGPQVVKLLLTDQAYGGEVNPGPVVFYTGRYEYDQDAGAATITPFQTVTEDFASLLANRAARQRARKVYQFGSSSGPGLWWWFAGQPERKWHYRRALHHKKA